MALRADGTVVAWGGNNYGQCTVPDEMTNGVAIAAGWAHSLALRVDGTVVAWGYNVYGLSTVPEGLTNVVAIAAGYFHNLALKSDTTVVAWGSNGDGQSTVPDGLTNVVAIAGGYSHSLGLQADGTVVAWGANWAGQSTVPDGLSSVVAIAAGGYHNLALRSDGTVVGWGHNHSGQATGEANTVFPYSSTGTVAIAGQTLSNVMAVAAGIYHSLALRADGTVVAWGENYSGQATVPDGLSNVVTIAAGKAHNLAVGSFAPVITVQPFGQAVQGGADVTLVAQAAGLKPLSYQWQLNGTNIPGATNTSLALPNVQQYQSGTYVVIVTNAYGVVTSSNAVVAVGPPPACTIPPAGLVGWWPGEGNADDTAGTNNGVLQGGVAFVDGAVGEAFSFDGVSGFIANATPGLTNICNSYTMEFWALPGAGRQSTPEDLGWYGSGWSGQRYAIFPSSSGVTGLAGVGVSVGTNGVSVIESGPFGAPSVLVYNAPILGWTHIAVVYRNQEPALYVNGTLVRIGLVTGTDSYPPTCLGGAGAEDGSYAGLLDEVSIHSRALSACEIQAIYNAGTAGKCQILWPAINSQPDRYRAVLVGGTNTFTVGAIGDPPLSYQWCRDGTNILGATTASLTLTNIQLADAGTYSVEVSNSYGSTNSNPAILVIAFPNSSLVKYVNVSNATPAAPFATWATAAIHIQDAVLFANDADTVLVRRGVYDENIDFMGKAIVLTSEECPGVTIIDGNRLGSVVTISGGEGRSVMLQGFTLMNGYAAQGGGIYCTNASPVISNCTITGSSTRPGTNGQYIPGPPYPPPPSTPGGDGGDGGGLYASEDSWPTIIDCVISNNITGTGGLGGGQARCGNGGGGGGIACSSASIVRTIVTDNATGNGGTGRMHGPDNGGNGGNGGGIICGSAVTHDSVIHNNATGLGGDGWHRPGDGGKGGGIYSWGDTVVERGTFCRNSTGTGGRTSEWSGGNGGDGGGVYAAQGSLHLQDCSLLENWTAPGARGQDDRGGSGGNGAGLCASEACTLTLSACSFLTNVTGDGGLEGFNYWSHGRGGNGGRGGAVVCSTGTVSACVFRGNRTGGGGAAVNSEYDREADGGLGGDGGAMYVAGDTTIENCLFIGNATGNGAAGRAPSTLAASGGRGGNGGGIWSAGAVGANCTIVGNMPGAGDTNDPGPYYTPGLPGTGGGIWCTNGVVVNTILWSNDGSQLDGGGIQLAYSDIESGSGLPWFNGTCLEADPQFASPLSGDWHLACTSPCINAGTNEAWMAGATDLDGNPRIRGGVADMGAFEVQNDSPLAPDLAAATRQGLPLTLATEILLARASDPESDPLAVCAVSPASLSGALVVLGGGAVVYTPPIGFIGPDQFSYTVSDGCGGKATANVFVTVLDGNAQSHNMLPPLYTPEGLLIRFAGIVGRTYSVQRAPAVTGPWVPIGTATVGLTGIASFLDPNPPPDTAFYRTTYP